MGVDWNFVKETFFEVGNFWGQAIVYLIMALFVLGTIIILLHSVRIFREKSWLVKVKTKIQFHAGAAKPGEAGQGCR